MRTTTFVWMTLALTPLGCATHQQLLEMETQLKARMEKMEAAQAAEKGRVDQLTKDLATVSATANDAKRIGTEAAAAAADARQRADAAAAKGEAVDERVTKALSDRLARTKVQEFQVTFETGRAELSTAAEQTLLEAAKLMGDNPTYTADLIGYTDDVGTAGSNVNLSWRREEAVRRFLVERGVELNRFSFIGVGEELSGDDTKDAAKRAKNRRVTVTIFKFAEN